MGSNALDAAYISIREIWIRKRKFIFIPCNSYVVSRSSSTVTVIFPPCILTIHSEPIHLTLRQRRLVSELQKQPREEKPGSEGTA